MGSTFLSIPAFVIASNPTASFSPWELVGLAVWALGYVIESVADSQKMLFLQRMSAAGEKDRVCDVGLWRYSRHPNYFFEWLIWVAFFVFALGSPWGWLALIGPASILYLLLRVTGIPLTEEQSIRSKGDAYRRYQQTTSAFIPWFPKKPTSAS